jgi:hypothetical protein
MPNAASPRREKSLTDIVKYLAAHLEMADADVGRVALPALNAWEAVDAKAGRETTAFDRAHVLACIHQESCQARHNPDEACEACALSSAILWACIVADEQHAHDLADAVGDLMRGLSALEEGIAKPLERFEKGLGMRHEPCPLPDDLRRRSVAPAIRRAFSAARRLLRDVPRRLHPEEIYESLRASPERKPGPKPDGTIAFLADVIKQKTGWGARRVAEAMGLERDDIRNRRKRREPGPRHEPN